MALKVYTLWSYDVWGNEEDGWEVNDRCCLSRLFEIHAAGDDATDEEIRLALVACGYLKDGFAIETDGDDRMIEVTQANNGYPLFGLEWNDALGHLANA
jgi:hypothetical protein